MADLRELSWIISAPGPSRVGRSTAAKHLIARQVRGQRVDPSRILFFAFDAPGPAFLLAWLTTLIAQ